MLVQLLRICGDNCGGDGFDDESDDIEGDSGECTEYSLAVVKFFALALAGTLTLSYMNSVPTAKKCLLLYLYKDTISSFLWMRFIWMIKQLVSDGNIEGLSTTLALVISFILLSGTWYMALMLISISIYKLYMAKTKAIDPKIPFLDEDEEVAIRKIRVALFLVVLVFLSTTFALGEYPSSFYDLKPDNVQKENMLISNIIYRGTLCFLLLVSGIITMVLKCYEATTELQMDKIIPKAIKYLANFFPAILTLFTVGSLIVASVLPFPNIHIIRKIVSIMLSIVIIVGPFLMIFKSDQLKAHSLRFLKDTFDDLFFLNIYLVPFCAFLSINLLMFFIL